MVSQVSTTSCTCPLISRPKPVWDMHSSTWLMRQLPTASGLLSMAFPLGLFPAGKLQVSAGQALTKVLKRTLSAIGTVQSCPILLQMITSPSSSAKVCGRHSHQQPASSECLASQAVDEPCGLAVDACESIEIILH